MRLFRLLFGPQYMKAMLIHKLTALPEIDLLLILGLNSDDQKADT